MQTELQDASSSVSVLSYTTVIGRPVGQASASVSLVFISNGIVKMFPKTMGRKKTNTDQLLYWLGIN